VHKKSILNKKKWKSVDTVVIIVKYFKKKLRVHKAINNTELFTISLMLMIAKANQESSLLYTQQTQLYTINVTFINPNITGYVTRMQHAFSLIIISHSDE